MRHHFVVARPWVPAPSSTSRFVRRRWPPGPCLGRSASVRCRPAHRRSDSEQLDEQQGPPALSRCARLRPVRPRARQRSRDVITGNNSANHSFTASGSNPHAMDRGRMRSATPEEPRQRPRWTPVARRAPARAALHPPLADRAPMRSAERSVLRTVRDHPPPWIASATTRSGADQRNRTPCPAATSPGPSSVSRLVHRPKGAHQPGVGLGRLPDAPTTACTPFGPGSRSLRLTMPSSRGGSAALCSPSSARPGIGLP